MASSIFKLPLFLTFFFTLITLVLSISQEGCESYTFTNNNLKFAACTDLPLLNCSIHWNYHSVSNSIDLAFRNNNAKHNTWISWGINPTSSPGMVGTQAFVAFQKSDGTMVAYTSPLTSYATILPRGTLTFPVHSVSGSFHDGVMVLLASFDLPGNSTTSFNHVWQVGSVSHDDVPMAHALSGDNLKSFGQINFFTANVSHNPPPLRNSRTMIRKAHGIVNGIGFGILMPIGVMMGRYLKTFNNASPAWFHLHRTCQMLAYLLGVAGFSLGMYMGRSDSLHAYIGIALFSFATAQVLVAIFLRPKKDSKIRILWNVFHYVVGYGILAFAIFNMFRGFFISNSSTMWRNIYTAVIISLGCIAAILEVITWFLVCKNRVSSDTSDSEVDNDTIQHKEIL